MEIEKKLRVLNISADLEVSVTFDEVITTEAEGQDDEAGVINNSFFVKSKHTPHKDFTDALKKLRPFALEICEMSSDTKEKSSWAVTSIKISGDLLMKTSRVVLMLGKELKGGKILKVGPSPQVTMYPTAEEKVPYHNADKMANAIEAIEREVWLYLGGKYEQSGQIALFPEKEAVEA